jgi:hypothetical protein
MTIMENSMEVPQKVELVYELYMILVYSRTSIELIPLLSIWRDQSHYVELIATFACLLHHYSQIAKIFKHPNYQQVNRWNEVYKYTMEYY